MSGYVLSPRAKADIDEIWDYTVAHWNLEQAETYIRWIQAAIEVIAAEPETGRSCEAVRAGYRKHSVGSHIIFFRLTRGGIDVVRILHGRMDFERHL